MTDENTFEQAAVPAAVPAASFPPKVAAAICAVMAAVPKLSKNDENQHGRYKFTSIDTFLEVVGRLCAEQGLFIIQDEESFEIIPEEKKDRSPWLRVTFRFSLVHASGEMWEHRPTRSIMVNAAMGAQAFGAAQAYTLKQFERSLFQIATGDSEDADFNEQTNLPRHSSAPRETGNSKPQPGDLGATDFKAALRTFDYLRVSILQAMRGKELTPREANDRISGATTRRVISWVSNCDSRKRGKNWTVKFPAQAKQKKIHFIHLMRQCNEIKPTRRIWRESTAFSIRGNLGENQRPLRRGARLAGW
jgi:hypothetical protein